MDKNPVPQGQPHRIPATLAFGRADADPAAAAPMSAARLAAEAAFAGAQVHTLPLAPTQITTRRNRLALLAAPDAADEDSAAADGTEKRPRVFRVAAAAPVPAPAPVPATAQAIGVGETTRHAARPRRLRSDKRSGPILQVLSPLPARPPEPAPSRSDWHLLRLELDRVGQTLQAIQTLVSWRIVDDRLADEWQRMSRQADELLVQLRKALRAPAAGPRGLKTPV
jgi:hypothetical protein